MTKKIFTLALSLVLTLGLVCSAALAAGGDKTLRFNEDGKFKIMMMNDLQDTENTDARTLSFMRAALDSEKPDLVVIAGDMLSDMYPLANKERMTKAIDNLMAPMVERNIPYLITFGNHDHDREDKMSAAEQLEAYKAYEQCYVPDGGCDPGTYNVPVLASGSDDMVFNIYMMDTNNKSELVSLSGYEGVRANQVEWYKLTSDSLKAANGGAVVPSLLFQHIPVKEIYQFLTRLDWGDDTSDAVFGTNDYKWYTLNEDYIISEDKALGEAPCSELETVVTGQYEAWLEKGDIIGAYFGHDHVNSFVGVTDDGIKMGYNGGTGFNAYGNGGNRSVRVFTLDEADPEAYETYIVTYNELMDKNIGFVFSDLLSTKILTLAMRAVNAMFGWLIALF